MGDFSHMIRIDTKKAYLKMLAIGVVVSAVAAVILYYSISAFVMSDAEDKIRNVMLSHRGLHHYIQRVMHPTFYKARDGGGVAEDFYSPEILSSSFMVRTLHGFYNEERTKAGLPEIYYKLASHNPRNPVNRADPFETSLIRYFNENRDITEYRRIENIDGKKYLYYAKPFLVTTKQCIRCHGKREDAPPGLQALYAGQGGFNEQEGVIRAIESIRMPVKQEISMALLMSISLATGVLVLSFLALFNNRLRFVVRDRTALLEAEVIERRKRESELEKKNAELERFTYTVSHDLKSPLITIKGFAGALLKDIAAGRHNRLEGDIRRIMDASDKMTALLGDLLELSRVGRMINPPVEVKLDELVRDVVAQLAGPLARHNVEVAIQPGLPAVFADRARLAEVIQNLVENAIKYRGDQPAPRIDIGMRGDNATPVFFVCDNGIGIDERYHETVFGLFNKLDTHSEGTGIGLALSRRIIEFHGGRIWVESEGSGKGSTFCFTLPKQGMA